MPFENVTREGRIFWRRPSVLLSDDLEALGAIRCPARAPGGSSGCRCRLPRRSPTQRSFIGQLVGADRVVIGTGNRRRRPGRARAQPRA
jgi:hypothetical protein